MHGRRPTIGGEPMTTSLALREDAQMSIQDVMTLADAFVRSGYFRDASDQAKAVVKIIYGRDLGIGAMAAMNGVHIVEGKPSLSAGLIGALVKRSGKYTYRVAQCDNTGATLEFFERDGATWTNIGLATFDANDAKAAGLVGKQNWNRYASDMMFARALTRGARRYCPDVFLGPVYVPEELGADFHPETGEAIAELPATIAQNVTGETAEVTPLAVETHSPPADPADDWPFTPKHWGDEIKARADAIGKDGISYCMAWIRATEMDPFRRSGALAICYKELAAIAPNEAALLWIDERAEADNDLHNDACQSVYNATKARRVELARAMAGQVAA